MNKYLTTKQAEFLANGGGGGGSVEPYSSNPEMDGTASPGSSAKYARGDHVHPRDTSIPSAATAIPVADGVAAVGSSSKYAKEDHVHPTDTSRASVAIVAASATISSSGLITFTNSSSTSLFTLQLPIYNGGVS